jgi:hypothetical protein
MMYVPESNPLTEATDSACPSEQFNILHSGTGSKVRAMRFVDTYQKYESDDATLLALSHYGLEPRPVFCQRVPESILYLVREDGSMALFGL